MTSKDAFTFAFLALIVFLGGQVLSISFPKYLAPQAPLVAKR